MRQFSIRTGCSLVAFARQRLVMMMIIMMKMVVVVMRRWRLVMMKLMLMLVEVVIEHPLVLLLIEGAIAHLLLLPLLLEIIVHEGKRILVRRDHVMMMLSRCGIHRVVDSMMRGSEHRVREPVRGVVPVPVIPELILVTASQRHVVRSRRGSDHGKRRCRRWAMLPVLTLIV